MSEDGLLPQLMSGLQLFYAGLDALGDSRRPGGGGLPERELVVDGIPVTVVDRVGLPGTPGSGPGEQPAFEASSGDGGGGELVSGSVRLQVLPAQDAPAAGAKGGVSFAEAGEDAAAGVPRGTGGPAGEGSLHEDGPLIVEEAEEGPEAFLAP
jgi:hypothetical protein